MAAQVNIPTDGSNYNPLFGRGPTISNNPVTTNPTSSNPSVLDSSLFNNNPTLQTQYNVLSSQGFTPTLDANGNITGFSGGGDYANNSQATSQNQTFENLYNTDLAAKGKYQGDVSQFENNMPLYRGQALGNIVGRGLGASFDPNNQSLNSGALGSQVMNQFNQNVGNTLGSMADSYNKFMGDQTLQQQARTNALSNFFANQNYLNQWQQQQQPGLSDYASVGLGVASLL